MTLRLGFAELPVCVLILMPVGYHKNHKKHMAEQHGPRGFEHGTEDQMQGQRGWLTLNTDGTFLCNTSDLQDTAAGYDHWDYVRNDEGTYVEHDDHILFTVTKSFGRECKCPRGTTEHKENCRDRVLNSQPTEVRAEITRGKGAHPHLTTVKYPLPDGEKGESVSTCQAFIAAAVVGSPPNRYQGTM